MKLKEKMRDSVALRLFIITLSFASITLASGEDVVKPTVEPASTPTTPPSPPAAPTVTSEPAATADVTPKLKSQSQQVIPTISFVNKNDGFQPSFEYERSLRNHASIYRGGKQLPKVKREDDPASVQVQLFEGSPPTPNADTDNQENKGHSNNPGAEPAKTPRGYYDESQYRDYGPSSAYGNNVLPSNSNVDDDMNELDVVRHNHHSQSQAQPPQVHVHKNYNKQPQQLSQQLSHQNFQQDPFPQMQQNGGNAKYRTSFDKYEGGHGPSMQSRPSYSSPYETNRPQQQQVGHPYAFDNGGGGSRGFGNAGQGQGQSSSHAQSQSSFFGDEDYGHGGGSPYHPGAHMPTSIDGPTSVRQSQSEIGINLGPGVGKALKLLLPSALLLTGVSALFPNRVYVPTQPKNIRQKRGADYTPPLNTDENENIEYIPASLLRREHRTGEDEPILYDYDDGTPNPYIFGSYAAGRKAKVQALEEATAGQGGRSGIKSQEGQEQTVQEPTVKAQEEYDEDEQPQSEGVPFDDDDPFSFDNGDDGGNRNPTDNGIPEFMPIPTRNPPSTGGAGADAGGYGNGFEYDDEIDIDSLPPQEYDIFKIRDQQKKKQDKVEVNGKAKSSGSSVKQQQQRAGNTLNIGSPDFLNTNPEQVPAATLSTELITATQMSTPLARILGAAPTTAITTTTTATTSTAGSTSSSLPTVGPSSSSPVRNGLRRRMRKRRPNAALALVSPTPTPTPVLQQITSESTTRAPVLVPSNDFVREMLLAASTATSPSVVSINLAPTDDKPVTPTLSSGFRTDKKIDNSPKQQALLKSEPPIKSEVQGNFNSGPKFDLSPDGPVMGLLNAAAAYRQDSDVCQKRALCDLAVKGTNPDATKFETFLWSLANLTPEAFTIMYEIDDVFQAIRDKNCSKYNCMNPNHDIQM